MTPHYADESVTLHHGDCLDILRTLPDATVDAVVTDPPYGLEFMGKDWDRPWAVGMSSTGYTDGGVRLARPAFGDSRNANCRTCGGRQRGAKRCICDAPNWDRHPREDMLAFQVWCTEWATECLRVLKPGGHLLAFGGSRTWHRLAAAVEDAGFEIRDSIAWLYGSGFPKSLDVSKAIDKQRTEDRAPVDAVRAWLNARRLEAGLSHDAVNKHFGHASNGGGSSSAWMTNPSSRSLPTWAQWLALKELFGFGEGMDAEVWRLNGRKGQPGDSYEAREVLSTRQVADIRNGHGREYGGAMFAGEQTGKIDHATTAPATEDAQRWQGWGTALKPAFEPIVVARKPLAGTVAANVLQHGTGALNIDGCRIAHANAADLATSKAKNPGRADTVTSDTYGSNRPQQSVNEAGRWPTNVVLDESQATELDKQTGVLTSGANPTRRGVDGNRTAYGDFAGQDDAHPARGADSGGASRFFPVFRYEAKAPTAERPRDDETTHPTVKPLDLMRWLIRLVTPPGGTVLEPFAGSGTTAEACVIEGFKCVAIEREADYLPLIVARLTKPIQMGLDFGEAG